MKPVGLDIGYAQTKVVSTNHQSVFPSIVGTPDQSQFQLNEGSRYLLIQGADGKLYNVGQGAVEQSRFTARQEDRNWITSKEYGVILTAALSTLLQTGTEHFTLVTGLPVAFYGQDKDTLTEVIRKTHAIIRPNQDRAIAVVDRMKVIPQGMGAVLDVGLNMEGDISDALVASGSVGVIDIGGKTTNLIHSRKLGDVPTETDSISMGGWDAVRALRDPIQSLCPDVDYKDYEIADAIARGHINYRGKQVDLQSTVAATLEPMAMQIVSKARQLWQGSGAKLDAILLAGGGSLLLGEWIMKMLDHGNIRVVEDSVFSNARGYYKLAVRATKVGQ